MKTFKQFMTEAIYSPNIDSTGHSYAMWQKHEPNDSIENGNEIGHFKKISHIRHNGKSFHILAAKVGTLKAYRVIDPQKKLIHMQSSGYENHAGNYEVDETQSTGFGPKVHKIYAHLVRNGHQKMITGTAHSPGGAKVWNRLGAERGINVHGWLGGKPVNLDPTNPHETHNIDDYDNHMATRVSSGPEGPKKKKEYFERMRYKNTETNDEVAMTRLVASKKFHTIRRKKV